VSAQTNAEQRLSALDTALPAPPTPFGAYVEAVKIGNLLFLSGMLPVVGHAPQYLGRVGGALSVEDGRKAAEMACLSALSAAKAYLGALDKITGVAKLGVYIATEGDGIIRRSPTGPPSSSSKSSAPGCFRAASSSASPACPLACRSKSNSSLKSQPSVASRRHCQQSLAVGAVSAKQTSN
jgi:enamine deaminase RidA (YjgF/YER057c/UK114 family)